MEGKSDILIILRALDDENEWEILEWIELAKQKVRESAS